MNPLLKSIIDRYKTSTFVSMGKLDLDSLRAIERQYSHYTSDSFFVNAIDYFSFTEVLKKIIVTPKEKLEADKKLNMADDATFSL